jgi:hypothetical protein
LDETRVLIGQAVAEPERAARMQALIDELRTELKTYAGVRDVHIRALADANTDYGTSREEMRVLYDAYDEDVRAILEKLAETHLRLKAMATDEEWAVISRPNHRIGGIEG